MSSNDVNLNKIIEAIAEDPALQPIEKETSIGWTKDGSPTRSATEYERDVAKVYTEERGPARRVVQHPHFRLTELRVNDATGKGRDIEPCNFSGGTVTGVGGFIPIATVKMQTSIRSASGHANVVTYQGASSNSPPRSGESEDTSQPSGAASERVKDDSTDDGNPKPMDDDGSETVGTQSPLDW